MDFLQSKIDKAPVFLNLFIRFCSHEDTESQEEFNIADALNSHVPEMAIRACSTTTMDSDNVDQVVNFTRRPIFESKPDIRRIA